MLKEGRVRKGSHIDIHHVDGNPANNSRSNVVLQHRSKNRSFPRK